MTEKYKFVASGHINEASDLKDIEFWGHDAGEFLPEEIEEIVENIEEIINAEKMTTLKSSE